MRCPMTFIVFFGSNLGLGNSVRNLTGNGRYWAKSTGDTKAWKTLASCYVACGRLLTIRSNSSEVQYLPVKAAFRGSDADLLKLLIEPLYGNRPEIGLRELIQNAVDASE